MSGGMLPSIKVVKYTIDNNRDTYKMVNKQCQEYTDAGYQIIGNTVINSDNALANPEHVVVLAKGLKL